MTKKTATFKDVEFNIDSTPCCGILNIGDFSYDQGQTDWYNFRNSTKARTFTTKEAQLKAIEKRYTDGLFSSIYNDGHYEGGQYLLQASIVTKYRVNGNHQCPEMEEFLLSKGFKVNATWKNHNTGNTLKFFQKKLTNKEIKDLYKTKGVSYKAGDRDDDDSW